MNSDDNDDNEVESNHVHYGDLTDTKLFDTHFIYNLILIIHHNNLLLSPSTYKLGPIRIHSEIRWFWEYWGLL